MNARAKISLVLLFFASCGTAAILTAYLQMRADANVKPADLYAVVNQQLGDLRQENFPAAYSHASHEISSSGSPWSNLPAWSGWITPCFMETNQAEYGPVEARGNRADDPRLPHRAVRAWSCPAFTNWCGNGKLADRWRPASCRPGPSSARLAGTML